MISIDFLPHGRPCYWNDSGVIRMFVKYSSGTATLPSTPSALLRTILEKQKCSKGDYDRKEAPLNIANAIQSTPRTPGW